MFSANQIAGFFDQPYLHSKSKNCLIFSYWYKFRVVTNAGFAGFAGKSAFFSGKTGKQYHFS